ncbi:MAG: hypothetical protein GDA41_01645 [Rhodospirillales bacterium]|nr:hypothetical protein [Rhodospirillales bacterium]
MRKAFSLPSANLDIRQRALAAPEYPRAWATLRRTAPPAIEVMTRALQLLSHKLPGDKDTDPEMPRLVLGLLFHYDPA